MESWEVILLRKLIASSDNEGYSGMLGGHSVNEAIASSDNEGMVESWEVILLMKLLQAVTMKE